MKIDEIHSVENVPIVTFFKMSWMNVHNENIIAGFTSIDIQQNNVVYKQFP